MYIANETKCQIINDRMISELNNRLMSIQKSKIRRFIRDEIYTMM